MSAWMPVSSWRTLAAFAVGATPNTARSLFGEVVGCRLEGGGLAGAGGPDDEHEPIVSGDRRGGRRLEDVEPFGVDRGRR